ncbi:MAG: hypothetical protein ABIF89_02410, partial [bacterium]
MKIFSFDAETNGLWGQPFAIGALVLDSKTGQESSRFVGRCPIEGTTDRYVEENVLPAMAGMPETYDGYESLLRAFAKFYLANKEEAQVLVHMGYVVEAGLLHDMRAKGLIGEWDGPYPLYDVSGNLDQMGEDPTSVDDYAQKHGLVVPVFEGGTHNPLYDAAVAAAVYRHLK